MFTLLHTNDFHNALNSAQADVLRRMRSVLRNRGLLVDAGDAVASGNMSFRPGGEEILRTMSEIGYDALTVGNREFHFSKYGLQCKIGQAQFPVLCANMRPARLSSHLSPGEINNFKQIGSEDSEVLGARVQYNAEMPIVPYIVRNLEHNGTSLRVLLLGLTVPMITERMLSRKISAYIFDDPIAVAAQLVPQLRAEFQPDLFAALTHIGIGQDRKLAQAVPGLDLIIGGHTHVVLPEGERVGETLLVQAGSHGRFVGRIDAAPSAHANGRPYLCASLTPLLKAPTEEQVKTALHSLELSAYSREAQYGESQS